MLVSPRTREQYVLERRHREADLTFHYMFTKTKVGSQWASPAAACCAPRAHVAYFLQRRGLPASMHAPLCTFLSPRLPPMPWFAAASATTCAARVASVAERSGRGAGVDNQCSCSSAKPPRVACGGVASTRP